MTENREQLSDPRTADDFLALREKIWHGMVIESTRHQALVILERLQEACERMEKDPYFRSCVCVQQREQIQRQAAEIDRVDAMARERDDLLHEIGSVVKRHEARIYELAVASDEEGRSDG